MPRPNTSNYKISIDKLEQELHNLQINKSKIKKIIKQLKDQAKKNQNLTNTLRVLAPGIEIR